jgi:hypothetical protein
LALRPIYVWSGTDWVQVGDASTPKTTINIQQEAPEGGVVGSIWYDDEAGGLYVYDGTYWVGISGPRGPAGASVDVSLYATVESLNSASSSILNYVDQSIENVQTETFLIKEENYSINVSETVFVNTESNSYTITLPETPTLGDKVKIVDLSNNAFVNNIIVSRNGLKINGESSDFIIDVNNAGVELIYTDNFYGWRTLND